MSLEFKICVLLPSDHIKEVYSCMSLEYLVQLFGANIITLINITIITLIGSLRVADQQYYT